MIPNLTDVVQEARAVEEQPRFEVVQEAKPEPKKLTALQRKTIAIGLVLYDRPLEEIAFKLGFSTNDECREYLKQIKADEEKRKLKELSEQRIDSIRESILDTTEVMLQETAKSMETVSKVQITETIKVHDIQDLKTLEEIKKLQVDRVTKLSGIIEDVSEKTKPVGLLSQLGNLQIVVESLQK